MRKAKQTELHPEVAHWMTMLEEGKWAMQDVLINYFRYLASMSWKHGETTPEMICFATYLSMMANSPCTASQQELVHFKTELQYLADQIGALKVDKMYEKRGLHKELAYLQEQLEIFEDYQDKFRFRNFYSWILDNFDLFDSHKYRVLADLVLWDATYTNNKVLHEVLKALLLNATESWTS